MADFRLGFDVSEISALAERYAYRNEDKLVEGIGPKARQRGYLTRREFLVICEWKTVRSKSRCARNPEARIREATRLAFGTSDEEAKIGILRLLDGVEWPTASVLLHFCDRQPYPILDFRALWSLGIASPPPYSFGFWQEYTRFTRELAARLGQSMRTLDRALWQYSKENQRRAGTSTCP